MNRRLYEVAKELQMSSTELTEQIQSLGLSFTVENHLSVIEEEQISELQAALQARAEGRREQRTVKSGVIRRRARRRVVAPTDGPGVAPAAAVTPAAEAEAAPEAVAPVRRRKVVSAAEPKVEQAAPAPKAAETTTEKAAQAEPKQAEEVVPEAPEAAPEAAPVVEAAPEPVEAAAAPEAAHEAAPSRFATINTRPVTPAAEAETPETPAARPRFATVVREEGDAAAPSPVELAALARQEADERAAQRSSARVVGAVNPELLNTRIDTRRPSGPGPGAPGRPGFGPPADAAGGPGRGRKAKRGKRVVQSRELYDKFRRSKRKKGGGGGGQQTQITTAAEHKRVVKMEESILVSDVAHQMGVKAGEIAMKLMFDFGIRGANINTAIDYETTQLVAELYQWKVEQVGFDISKFLPEHDDSETTLVPRAPVVTVMGHVDHGKTSLLDALRRTAVTEGEAGGITQHIGAYKISAGGGEVCFLDTPGHEAFTALRARGAQATDIVVLLVAADDGVMPQTVEAINHSRDAEVPIIVAINKVDKPEANVERIKQALTEYQLVSEEWGGDTIIVEVSAKTGAGLDKLIEMIELQAEILELKANPDRVADGVVLEARLDTGRGPVGTVLVQGGTLKPGDIVVIGEHYGRVRTMNDDTGTLLESAGPATPVEITGLNGVPASGERFYVVSEEKDARTIAEHVEQQNRQSGMAQSATGESTGMDRLEEMMAAGETKEIKVIIKGDVQGSVEALRQSLSQLATDEVGVRIVHSGVGSITETDINLAASSAGGLGVVVIGFNVRPETRTNALADQLNVRIMTASIIYEVIDEVKVLMSGLLNPIFEEEVLGHAEVRATFSIPKVGTVAGCMVTDGLIRRNAKARVLRDSVIVYDSAIASLRHFEKDEKEVKTGFECGLSVERFNDIKEGDVIECYVVHEKQATL